MTPFSAIPDDEILSLLNASCQLVSCLDAENVAELIVHEAGGIVHAASCSLLLRDEDRGEMYFFAASGRQRRQIREIRFDADRGIAGDVLRTGRPVLSNDVRNDPRHYDGVDTALGLETISLLAVPIEVAGRTVGVLEAVNSRRTEGFTERDLQLLALFANFCGCALQNADTFERQQMECQAFRAAAESAGEHYGVFVGNSPAMRKVWEMAYKVAARDCTVLLTGESGVGKEVLARSIHQTSDRKDAPFLCVNCAALDENLLNSELFGHEKGAFTGAVARTKGKFEVASRGTLFFDEIGECSPTTQARLLRVLQEQTFERIGGTETIRTNSRILAATNADLEKRIDQGTFRDDLYHRINVVQICVPPLRQRREEIAPLLDHVVRQIAAEMHAAPVAFAPEALLALGEYDWPGNVRELRNFVERVMVLHGPGRVEADHLPEYLPQVQRPPSVASQAGPNPRRGGLWDEEKRLILEALEANRWNLSATARALDIDRHRLKYRVQKFGLKRPTKPHQK